MSNRDLSFIAGLHNLQGASSYKLVDIFVTDLINKPISVCVRMACDILLTKRLLSTDLSKVDCQNCYPQVCYKLFQQAVTSLQMTRCIKRHYNDDKVSCNLFRVSTSR